ncbi:hypothetical protein CPC08DRAFT_746446 [Agrocybe pediades]|nr:hypothetical protein CPC08DRAFT_746446 [Agrocybe pediades]
MFFSALIQFCKEQITSFISISLLALEIFDDRLAAKPGGVVKLSTSPVSIFAKRNGRLKSAALCVLLEFMACLFLIHKYGFVGALERTIPILALRAKNICLAVFARIFNCYFLLALRIFKRFAHSFLGEVIWNEVKPTVYHLANVLDAHCREVCGDDYLPSVIEELQALPEDLFDFLVDMIDKWLYTPCIKLARRVEQASGIVAFCLRRYLEWFIFWILWASVVVAFFFAFSVDRQSLAISVGRKQESGPVSGKDHDGDDDDGTLWDNKELNDGIMDSEKDGNTTSSSAAGTEPRGNVEGAKNGDRDGSMILEAGNELAVGRIEDVFGHGLTFVWVVFLMALRAQEKHVEEAREVRYSFPEGAALESDSESFGSFVDTPFDVADGFEDLFGVKESISISTSSIVSEAETSALLDGMKSPKLSSTLFSHRRRSSLDAMMSANLRRSKEQAPQTSPDILSSPILDPTLA